MKRHIGKLEEIIRTVMVEEPSFRIRPVGRAVPDPGAPRQTVSPEQVKPSARLNPILQRAKTLVVYPIPPACYPNDRNPRSLRADG